jgi:formyl-CoA transferase
MGTSEHAYGLLMKALFKREISGEGSRIDLAMFESTVSWLTVPVTMTASFDTHISRRGNTHEFFCPVSVYKTSNGFIYLAVGNDRQWQAMAGLEIFQALDLPQYRKNSGRIKDVDNLNRQINAITATHTSEALIELFNSITVPVSKIKAISEVIADPLVSRRLLKAQDPVTGKQITLAPPPNMTPFLENQNQTLSFPPRFGEQNQAIYGEKLRLSAEKLADLEEKGVI